MSDIRVNNLKWLLDNDMPYPCGPMDQSVFDEFCDKEFIFDLPSWVKGPTNDAEGNDENSVLSGCDRGAGAVSTQGETSNDTSIIDNHLLNYRHFGYDFFIEGSQEACSSCTSNSAQNSLPAIGLTRIHRYMDIGRPSSFGPGVFSNYDVLLTLYHVDGNNDIIVVWDPNGQQEFYLERSGLDYIDSNRNSIKHVQLFDGNGTQVSDTSLAVSGILTNFSGKTYHFDMIANDMGGDTQFGRLSSIQDRNQNAITLVYEYTANASLATLGNDRSKLWKLDSIADSYSNSLQFSYHSSKVNGFWAVSSVEQPNTSIISYTYANSIGGLSAVTFPDGTQSTFAMSYDNNDQLVWLDIFEVAEKGQHRDKRIGLSPSWYE
ncbi:MAG: hypothetical protein HRU15_05460, partial [Planctomycetes bacterium]|nr:hypothetical protein [Planctomycetota bacterium]